VDIAFLCGLVVLLVLAGLAAGETVTDIFIHCRAYLRSVLNGLVLCNLVADSYDLLLSNQSNVDAALSSSCPMHEA